MENRGKKVIVGCSFLAIIAICVGSICFGKTEKVLYTQPDKIIVYKSGEVIEVKDTDKYFQKLYELNGIPEDKDLLETSIEEETVQEIKDELALEYVYYNEQKMELAQGEKAYTKILFAYSGWCEDNVIFYNEGQYQSGTVYSELSKKALMNLYEEMVELLE